MHTLVGIPKEDGSNRLIAVMPTLLRVWSRARQPLAAQWEEDHPALEFWGGVGKSSTQAAFELQADREVATLQGGAAMDIFFDLWKCYEMVVGDTLLQEASATEFPARLCIMAILCYQLPRALLVMGSFSALVEAFQGILAGCSLAPTLLRVILLRASRSTQLCYPRVKLRVLLDDAALSWTTSKGKST